MSLRSAVAVVATVFLWGCTANVTKISKSGRITDEAGKPLPDVNVEVLIVEGREARIPERGTYITDTDANGMYQIIIVDGRGKHFRVLATGHSYEPQWRMFDNSPSDSDLLFALKKESPWEPRQFRVGEKVVVRDADLWCPAQIVTVGSARTATPEGAQDFSGSYQVSWDDWPDEQKQWEKQEAIRVRPAQLAPNPLRCPAVSRTALVQAIEKKSRKLTDALKDPAPCD